MKIVKLVAENVKRLHAVEIVPEGSLVTIGGKNAAGKSSVLDSIAYALGGQQLIPSEPIRMGETEARVVVDLGDLVVTRKFRREKIERDGPEHPGADKIVEWGETKSTLVVTNKDGARYPSPQAVLDRLLGQLTFDPLAFAHDPPHAQWDTLRRLVGLDGVIQPIEQRRREAYDHRTTLKRAHGTKAAQLAALPHYNGVPEAEVPMSEVASEMRQAEEYRTLAEDAEREVAKATHQVGIYAVEEKGLLLAIQRLEEQLRVEREKLATMQASRAKAERELEAKQITANAARAVVPDMEAIRARVGEVEALNAKVRANQRYMAAQAEVEALAQEVEQQNQAISKADEEKQAALAAAKFPVEGLGLGDDGVTLHNLPFEQAGSAEQIQVSVAIGIALNPTLKVLLVRNGNMLDSESLRAVAAQAEAAGMQVWCEWVTDDANDVAVMLVDGEVIGEEKRSLDGAPETPQQV